MRSAATYVISLVVAGTAAMALARVHGGANGSGTT